jgi:predicted membrane protein
MAANRQAGTCPKGGLDMSQRTTPAFRLTPQVVFGLAIVIFGLALTADNLGWLDANDILRFWPLAIVAAGLGKLFQSDTRSGQIFGGVIVLFGASLAAESVFHVRVHIWQWWPLAIVALGVLIMSKAFGRSTEAAKAKVRFGGEPGVPDTVAPTSDAEISEFALWSGIQRRIASPVFRRGDLTAIMGGIEVDLRQAATGGGEAVIDVFALWGGIEITVPPDWHVSNRVTAIMGGAEDSSSGTQAARGRLVVRGFAIMGGIEIKT